jgi:polysaccharide pyruvyl transferase CsaB
MGGHPAVGSGLARPLLCGYYGEHNLGDDALLAALLEQLPEGSIPLVTAFDEALVQARFQVATVARRSLPAVLQALEHCDALVLGGGSLLQDSTSFRSLLYYGALISLARLQGKPVLLWGQGLGPLLRQRSRLLVRCLLSLASACSWRDSASAALARGWGVIGPTGSDPVWALPSIPWHGHGGPILVCWRPTPLLEGEAWRPYLQALNDLAVCCDRPVHWLPFHHDQDGDLLARLAGAALLPPELEARSTQVAAADPREAQEHFAAAGLVLAMRLHALVLAALAGAPCVALSYDPKVQAAAEGLGCPCQDLAEPVRAEVLLTCWHAGLDRPVAVDRLVALQRQADVHRDLLNAGVQRTGHRRLPDGPAPGG